MDEFLIVCPTAPGHLCGVGDYSAWLACSLGTSASVPAWLIGLPVQGAGADTGLPAVRRIEVTGWRELWRRRGESPLADGTPIVQYVPQLYIDRLDSLWLLLWLVSVRAGGRRAVITVHEYVVPAAASVRRMTVRVLLPLVMGLVGAVGTHVVTTIGSTDRRLRRLLFWKRRRIALVPVGTNIPVRVADAPRLAAVAAEPLVCTLFGQPSSMSAAAVAAVGEWARGEAGRVRLRWVGRSRAEIVGFCTRECGLPPDLVEVLEQRPADEVSGLLASTDLFIAPLDDGVSTRRTTVVAALAHGLPVVGTRGPSTDPVVGESPACALAPVGAPAELVVALRAAASDADRRRRMGRAARELYDAHFTWTAIAAAYRRHLAG